MSKLLPTITPPGGEAPPGGEGAPLPHVSLGHQGSGGRLRLPRTPRLPAAARRAGAQTQRNAINRVLPNPPQRPAPQPQPAPARAPIQVNVQPHNPLTRRQQHQQFQQQLRQQILPHVQQQNAAPNAYQPHINPNRPRGAGLGRSGGVYTFRATAAQAQQAQQQKQRIQQNMRQQQTAPEDQEAQLTPEQEAELKAKHEQGFKGIDNIMKDLRGE